MTLPGLQVHHPRTVAQALELADRFGADAGYLAGGTELLLLLRLGVTHYDHLISLRDLPGRNEISPASDGSVRVGAGVTHQQVADSPFVRQDNPAFARVEGRLANLRVRVSGTLAGNLAFADPHSDTLTLLTAMDAAVECEGAAGIQVIPAAEFMLGPYTTRLASEEIITGLVIPGQWWSARLGYERLESRRQRPLLTVACAIQADPDGHIGQVQLVVGSVCPAPTVVDLAPSLVTGRRLDAVPDELVSRISSLAAESVPVRDDENGSATYKRNLVSVLVGRAVLQCLRG